jgi:hypothetical protein
LSSLLMAFVHDQHKRLLLRQYLESVLGLADNVLRVPSLSSLAAATSVAAAAKELANGAAGSMNNVLLQAGDGMEVEAADLEVSKDYYYIFIWPL